MKIKSISIMQSFRNVSHQYIYQLSCIFMHKFAYKQMHNTISRCRIRLLDLLEWSQKVEKVICQLKGIANNLHTDEIFIMKMQM
jgi:hypothetical protein